MRKETQGSPGWYRLGRLLIQLGGFAKVEQIYNVLHNLTSDDSEKVHLHHQLGRIKRYQNNYVKGLSFYEKSLVIYQKNSPYRLFRFGCYQLQHRFGIPILTNSLNDFRFINTLLQLHNVHYFHITLVFDSIERISNL
jgi:tetratricopeptide (TPR) repeat protein